MSNEHILPAITADPNSCLRITHNVPRRSRLRAWCAAATLLAGAFGLWASTNEVLYDDALENGWQFWGWATVDLTNTAPTHSGHYSISVAAGPYSALYLHNGQAGQWSPTVFNTLVFWAHGGTTGGQQLTLVGLMQSPTNAAADAPALTVNLPPLLANTWTEIQTPLTSLGVAGNPKFSAIQVFNNTGSAQPVFYLDDIHLTSDLATNSMPTNAVGANDLIIFDDRLNTAVWQNWSWATSLDWNNPSPIHSGTRSVAVQLDQWTAVAFHGCPPIDALAYPNFVFWVNGGAKGGQTLTVQGTINRPGSTALDGVYEHTNVLQTTAVKIGPLPPNAWQQQIVPLSALGLTGAQGAQYLGDLWIWNTTDPNQAEFYLDDLRMAAATSAPPTILANITVDVAAARRPINPMIYGTANASLTQLTGLNAPIQREGGDLSSTYNWEVNASNLSSDWYFESYPSTNASPGGDIDAMIATSQAAGAAPMVTMPMLSWVAKLGANRSVLWSFSVAKYGPQTGADPYYADAGNGTSTATGAFLTGNDPNDAYVPSTSAYQKMWMQHLTNRWGTATQGGVRYYLLDNEPSIWQTTHRDVQPKGLGMEAFLGRFIEYASMIKATDPAAWTVGPEEWGWPGYIHSGLDLQNGSPYADQAAHGGQYYLPWLLGQLQQHDQGAAQRLIDIFSVHIYPQGGEFSDDTSIAMQLRRNRSTRSLWDTNYVDESWICDCVQLIPRLKSWVASRYPGLQTAITEYNWGAENHINGATAQADILGIFGREGLDLATRWSAPNPTNCTYQAIQMYRNYDGNKSRFGDISVLAGGPNPDHVSVFAAQRSSDNAMTVMVINKQLTNDAAMNLAVANFRPQGSAQVWRLTATKVIARLPDRAMNGNALTDSLPAQSITLYVVPAYVVVPAPSLLLLGGPANGRVQIVLGGVTGERCILEASTDLKTWAPVSTNVLASPLVPLTVPASGSTEFYRAIAAP